MKTENGTSFGAIAELIMKEVNWESFTWIMAITELVLIDGLIVLSFQPTFVN